LKSDLKKTEVLLVRLKAFQKEAGPILAQYLVPMPEQPGRWAISNSDDYREWLKELRPLIEKHFGNREKG